MRIFTANYTDMAIYIHQLPHWPRFIWKEESIHPLLTGIRNRQGRLLGRMEAMGFSLQAEANLQTLTLDVLKSSEIEGELLDAEQVRSSIARRLGMDIAGLVPVDRNVDGVVEMMLDATQLYQQPLSVERLHGWHAALFPTGRSGMHKITVGSWRDNTKDDPMQVVSGAMGKEKVHFEAPEADRLEEEMRQFISWFNEDKHMDPVIKAAMAHLWFVTIHPFDDGNGRIGRAIMDRQLAVADGNEKRFYSMSSQILKERKEYYLQLEAAQKGMLDITAYLKWFLSCLDRAILNTDNVLSNILTKSHFWKQHAEVSLNARQIKMINQLLDGFEGNLTTKKWAKICKCSEDTALRDITRLMELDMLKKTNSGGRSTSYELVV
jgi:Fic family protein